MKVAMQALCAPVVTAMLFMMVFSVALGDRAAPYEGVRFAAFLAPGLIMMAVLQNAFANTSSSFVIGKVQGNIVDILMPPLGPGEVLTAMVCAGITRGVLVGCACATTLIFLGGLSMPAAPFIAIIFLLFGAMLMSFAGVLAGIWAQKFDSLAAITNFIIQPLAFLSGTFYSIHALPAPFDVIAASNPVFMVIDGFRYGMIGQADGSLLFGSGILIALNILLAILCFYIFKSGYRLKS
jgi:ABC-2 type transport system permease protein